jgi:hypothetical protein
MSILVSPRFFLAVLFLLFIENICLADCYITWSCGSSWQCAQLYGGSSGRRGPLPSCTGWVKQDADLACTCAPTTGATSSPATGDAAAQFGKQMGDLVWKSLTTPDQPKTAEQIEAERQAEILQQQRAAERQAKIQNYLNNEALKQQQKNAALDKEADDSLTLLDHKPPTMPDDELLSSKNDKAEPSTCTAELRGLSNDLNSFAAEARVEGVQFAASDVWKTSSQAAGKIGMKQYAEDYKILKGQVTKVKEQADSISEIKDCIAKGCSLFELSKKYNREIQEWVKGLGTQSLHDAADRVDKAAAFYRDYTTRLEQHNEKIINGVAKCIAN